MDPIQYTLRSRVVSTTGPVQDVHTFEESQSQGEEGPAGVLQPGLVLK